MSHSGSASPDGGDAAQQEVSEMLLEALSRLGGVDYLEVQARENPRAFLTLVGKLVPLQLRQKARQKLEVRILRFTPEATDVEPDTP